MAKLLAVDYDGTLKQGDVDKPTIENIKAFRKQGHYFGIVTGRSYPSLKFDLEKYGIPYDFLVVSGGAHILVKNNSLILKCLTEQQVLDITQSALVNHCEAMVASDGECFGRTVFYRRAIDDHFDKYKDGSYQMMIDKGKIINLSIRFIDEKTAEKIVDTWCEFGIYAFQNGTNIDVVAQGISKDEGILLLKKYLEFDQIFVVGDSYNDISMIKRFAGFAIVGSPIAVIEAASGIVGSVEELIDHILYMNDEEKWFL